MKKSLVISASNDARGLALLAFSTLHFPGNQIDN